MLPNWPAVVDYEQNKRGDVTVCGCSIHDALRYERERAEAALARLRVAVGALGQFARHYECDGDNWYSCPMSGECSDNSRERDECTCAAEGVQKTLAAIGEVPQS